jgi:truncated hemoglobin YjbI
MKEREGQKRFFGEWLGGATVYSEHAHSPLADRHDLVPITGALAKRWLANGSRRRDCCWRTCPPRS